MTDSPSAPAPNEQLESAPYWDPFDTSLKADPHPVWRRLRDEAPAYYNERYDFYALSRFHDVEAATMDPKTFSSAHGTVLELMNETPFGDGALMLFLDPPAHTYVRRLVSRAFTPRRVATLEGEIRALCASLLDAQRGRDSFDFVQDFGALVPSNVIATLLGVPSADRELVRHHIDATFHLEPGVGIVNHVAAEAHAFLHDYITAQLLERRDHPRDDLLTDLVHAEYTDGEGNRHVLDTEHAATFSLLLVSAGTETVARFIGWAGLLLAAHPDQREALARDFSLIPNAVEEILRYEAPSPVQARWTTRAVSLHGTVIPAGSKVLMLTASAGRDGRRYEDPDRFDIHRVLDHHVSFGYGIHFCLGAALARQEARIVLEEVLVRYPEWEVDLAQAVLLHTSTVRGYERLPVACRSPAREPSG